MMKKITASILVVILLTSVLTIYSSAATTLQQMIDSAVTAHVTHVTITENMTVDTPTTIPEGITVIVQYPATLTLTATLTVKGFLVIDGYLANNSISNITTADRGAITFTRYNSYYNPYYPLNYNGQYPYWYYPYYYQNNYYVDPNYCTIHNEYKVYCPICGTYYCPDCTPHSHSSYYSNTYPYYGYYYPASDYYSYYYGNNYYGILNCDMPVSSVASGSSVKIGTRITLSCSTDGVQIFYTTDGSIPTINSYRYTSPITVSDDTVIKAIAVKGGFGMSPVAVFKYTMISKVSFTDTTSYDGLDSCLALLIRLGVIDDGTTFNPKGSFTYTDLESMLKKMGIDMSKVSIDKTVFKDKDALTFNDFTYILYKALRTYSVIKSPMTNGDITIQQISGYQKIKNAAIYRAAFISFVENELFYDLDFNPSGNASRVYLAYALARAYELM